MKLNRNAIVFLIIAGGGFFLLAATAVISAIFLGAVVLG